jgi:hypothetical protein
MAIQSVVGKSYQLQSTLSILNPAWVNEGAAVVGTGADVLLNAAVGADPSKFYRVIVQ